MQVQRSEYEVTQFFTGHEARLWISDVLVVGISTRQGTLRCDNEVEAEKTFDSFIFGLMGEKNGTRDGSRV